MEKASKRFDDFIPVDCNECSHYWDSSCDGASKGARVGCNSYSATRNVVIPERLKALEKRVHWLTWCVGFLLVNVIALIFAYILAHGMGWV